MSRGGDDGVCIGTGVCIRETKDAILVELDAKGRKDAFGYVAGGREVWLPKSCVHDDSEVFAAKGTGKVIVAAWFAEKEGLC